MQANYLEERKHLLHNLGGQHEKNRLLRKPQNPYVNSPATPIAFGAARKEQTLFISCSQC